MFAIKQGFCPSRLDDWGSVAALGSEIIEGECRASGTLVHGTSDAPLSCGFFACTRGSFRMVYPFNEHATVVEGRVSLTDEVTGETRTYGVGDSWFIAKGTPILWRIETERFAKNYMAAA